MLTRPQAPFVVLAFTLPIVALLAPKASVLILLLAAVWSLPLARWKFGFWPRLPRDLGLALAALLVWALAASFWTFDVQRAVVLCLRLAALFAAGLWLAAVARWLGQAARNQIAKALVLGVLVVLAILIEERLLETPLLDALKGPEATVYDQLSRFNRGLTALAILSWPAAGWLARRFGLGFALPLPMAGLVVALFYESTAAILALSCGFIIAGLALLQPRLSRGLVLLVMAVALLASPWIVRALPEQAVDIVEAQHETAAQRLIIWSHSAERIAEKPLLGWGFDAARNMPDSEVSGPGGLTNALPLHPHNAALQVFLELGLPGVLLCAVVLALLLRGLGRLPSNQHPYGLACFVAAFAVALTAYGIWQNQWLALLILAAVLTLATAPYQKPG